MTRLNQKSEVTALQKVEVKIVRIRILVEQDYVMGRGYTVYSG